MSFTNLSDSGTSTKGRSIGHVRDQSAPTVFQMNLSICIIGPYGLFIPVLALLNLPAGYCPALTPGGRRLLL
jgi:hypothetical protein